MGVIKNPVQQQLYVNYRVDLTPTFLDVTDAAVSVVVVVVVVIALVLVVMVRHMVFFEQLNKATTTKQN